MTINGSGFTSSSQVTWNGAIRTATYISKTQLTIAVNASDIANAGTASVQVVNPTSLTTGVSSNVATFTIH